MDKKLQNALSLIEDCLNDYCQTNIESDKREQSRVDNAWSMICRYVNTHTKSEG